MPRLKGKELKEYQDHQALFDVRVGNLTGVLDVSLDEKHIPQRADIEERVFMSLFSLTRGDGKLPGITPEIVMSACLNYVISEFAMPEHDHIKQHALSL